MTTIAQALEKNRYPGNGMLFGTSSNGRFAVLAYFIMERDSHSQNYVFGLDGENVRITPFLSETFCGGDSSLYTPVYVLGGLTIMGNGEHTDLVRKAVLEGKAWTDPLQTQYYEICPPFYSPRITGRLALEDTGFSYELAIIKRMEEGKMQRSVFSYPQPIAGMGHFIYDYQDGLCSWDSFQGEPRQVQIHDGLRGFANDVWNALDEEFRISLFTRRIDLITGQSQTMIVNKNY